MTTLQDLKLDSHDISKLRTIFRGGAFECMVTDITNRNWTGELWFFEGLEFIKLTLGTQEIDIYAEDVF